MRAHPLSSLTVGAQQLLRGQLDEEQPLPTSVTAPSVGTGAAQLLQAYDRAEIPLLVLISQY